MNAGRTSIGSAASFTGTGQPPGEVVVEILAYTTVDRRGRREINLLVLAVATRRHRLALMWTVLDRPGNSGAAERIKLMDRYLARFGPRRASAFSSATASSSGRSDLTP